MSWLRAVGRASIWHPDAIPLREQKYRSLKRVWVPAYDLLAVCAGLAGVVYGSRLLDRLYGDYTDLVAGFFALVAMVCLLGVAFPRHWKVAFVGTSILVGMVIAYAFAILVSPSPEQLLAKEAPSWFIFTMLLLTLPLPVFYLELLATEWADRRAVERRQRLIGGAGE